MARKKLTVETLAFSGTEPTYVGVDALDTGFGDAFANDGQTFIVINNVDAADPLAFSMVTGATLGGLAVDDPTGTVVQHATDMSIFGPFPMGTYNQATGTFAGMVELDYTGTVDAVTDSSIAVIR